VRKVIYSMTVSLDGFIAARDGDIGWSAPDAELHRFHNDRVRQVGVQLCGRALYETMLFWEAPEDTFSAPEAVEFAEIWKSVPKVVFSTTLQSTQGNATLATGDVPEVVGKLKQEAGGDIAVGGAGLASALIRLDLVDEYLLFVIPVVLGGGTPYFPALDRSLELELLETRTFRSPALYLRYARARASTGASAASAT